MTDLTIDQLPNGHAPDGSEPLPSVQGGGDVKFTVSQIATYAVGSMAISAASIAGNYTGGPAVPTGLTQPQALALLGLTNAAKTDVDNAFSVAQTFNGLVPSVALTATNITLGGGQANVGTTLWVGLDAVPGGRARSGFFADFQSSTAAFRITGVSPGVVSLAGNEIIAGSGTLRAGSALMAATVLKVGYDATLGDGFYGYWDGNGIHGPTGSSVFSIRQQSSTADLQFIGYGGTVLSRFNNAAGSQYLEVGGNTPTSAATNKVVVGGGAVWADKYLQITPQTAPTHAEGRMYWDNADHTLSLQSEIPGSTLQVGQENWVRCVNKTGSTISDGSVVYISGAQGNRPTMSLALSNSGDEVHRTIGVTTADTPNNAEGYVTVLGIVRGINTSDFAEGDLLYVSTTTPGALTNVEPVFPDHAVTVGYALNSTMNGSIFVSVDVGTHYQDFHRQHGFNSRTDATLSFVPGTRVFTLAPTATTYRVWREGAEYQLATKTVTLPATTGFYFVYLDASNVLTASTTPWSILDTSKIFVATVFYYHPSAVYAINEERHGAGRNLYFHRWAHKTVGTRYETGLTGTLTDTSLSITQGVIHDEDIDFSTVSTRTSCRLWRYSASDSSMMFTEETTPYLVSGGVLQWDNAGTPTNVQAGRYVVNDVYATTDDQSPIWVRVGTSEYATLSDAQSAVSGPVATWNSLGLQELKLLYRAIYRNLGGTPSFISSTDFRTASTIPGGGSASVAPHASTHASGGSDQISSLGTVTFTGTDPGSASAGQVNIGGGAVRAAGNIYATSFVGAGSSLTGITAAQVGAEPALGNPSVSGYALISTTGGVRSWAPLATTSTYPLHASGERMAIFYADLSSVNGFTSAADIAHFFCDNFDALVMVDGLWNPVTGATYTQAVAVCTEIKRVRPDFVLIGYIHTGETVAPVWTAAQLHDHVDGWLTNLFCDGIFMDECEYGFHTPRTKVNDVLTYIQSKITAAGRRMFGLVNCWNHAELLAGSSSIYDATYNPTSTPVSFLEGDALFHESLTYHYAFVSGSGMGYDNYISAAFLQAKETAGITLRTNFGLHYYGSNLLPTTGGSSGGGTPLVLTEEQFQQIRQDCASGCRILGADGFCLTYEGYSGTGVGSVTPRSLPIFQRSASFNYRRDYAPLVTWVTESVGGTPTVTKAVRANITYTSYYPVGGPAIHSFYDPDAVSGTGGGGTPSGPVTALLFTSTGISTAEAPSAYAGQAAVTAQIKDVTVLGLPTATDSNGGVMTLNQWTDSSGGKAMQVGWSDAGAFWRTGTINSGSWSSWNTFGLGASNSAISTAELPSAYNTKTSIFQVKNVSTLGIPSGTDYNGGLLTFNQWDSGGGSGLQVAWNDLGPSWRVGAIGGSSWGAWAPLGLSVISGLTPGSYTLSSITVDAYGRVTAASSGSGGSSASLLSIADTRAVDNAPNLYTSYGIVAEFKQTSTVGLPSTATGFAGVMTIKPWNDSTGGYATQLAFDEGGVHFRQAGNSATSWGSWVYLVSGSGTTGSIPLWSGTASIGNSVITQATNQIVVDGADTTTPSASQITMGNGVLRTGGKYVLGQDISLIPIAGNQSVITAWHGLQLRGAKQATVDYAPSNLTGSTADQFCVGVQPWQAGTVGLRVQQFTGQTANLLELRDSAGTTSLASFSSVGALTVPSGTVSQIISTSGAPTALRVTGAAHTGLTAATNIPDIYFSLTRTVQFAAGPKTAQYAVRVDAPIYSAVSATSTTDAATVCITGAPTAGTNMTLVNSYALLVTGTTGVTGKIININSGGTTSATMSALSVYGQVGVATNLIAIQVGKSYSDYAFLGVNKNTVTGSVPADAVFLCSNNTTSTMVIGRGSSGLPSSVDIGITSTGTVGIMNVGTATAALTLPASTAAISSLRIPHGTAPTNPVNGDVWTTTEGLFIRINGVTKTVTLT